jgi:hypothetical protein
MQVITSSIAVGAVALLAVWVGQAKSEGEKREPSSPRRLYSVECRVVSESPTTDTQQPLSFTAPPIVVCDGCTATISDTSDRTFVFGERTGKPVVRTTVQVQRSVTEGTTIEATVIGQGDGYAVLDLDVEFTSANGGSNEKEHPVKVAFAKGRWIDSVALGKALSVLMQGFHVDVTVTAVEETKKNARKPQEK